MDLKFCIVGRGSIGARHLMNLRFLGYNNVITFSEAENAEKDQKWLVNNGVKTLHTIEALARFHPDAFIIANPTSKHIMAAKMALDLKAHIFMEKPLSHSFDGVEELREEITKSDRIFFQANCLRFHPAFVEIKRALEQNQLGKIYFSSIQQGSYFPDWHKDEDYRVSYVARKELGGGVVLTMQHEIDYVYWLFGKFEKIKALVKKVSSLAIDVEDLACVISEMENGITVEIHLDFLQRPPKRHIYIQGEKGSIDFQYSKGELNYYDFNEQKTVRFVNFSNYDANQMYIDELKHFISCVKGTESPKITIDDAIYTLKICLNILNEGL